MKKPKAIAWDPSKGAAESAREVLPEIAAALFASGREAAAGRVKVEALHQLRLHTKRFRYTLEVFQTLYGPGLNVRLKKLQALQQHLGDINDCVTTRDLVTGLTGKKAPNAQKVLEWLDQREKDQIGKFLGYWKEQFDAPGEEERWLRYLRNYALRGKRSA